MNNFANFTPTRKLLFISEFLCDDIIDNGFLDKNCSRTIGMKCRYTCDKFHSPSVEASVATCHATGWSPDSKELCKGISVCNFVIISNYVIPSIQYSKFKSYF